MSSSFLTLDEQTIVVKWLIKGASPLAAVRQVGRDIVDYFHTLKFDAPFRQRCNAARAAIEGNVESALYKQAMEGKVAAQLAWLRLCRGGTDGDAGGSGDFIDDLDPHELERLAAAEGIEVSAETEAGSSAEPGEDEPRDLPPDPEPDE